MLLSDWIAVPADPLLTKETTVPQPTKSERIDAIKQSLTNHTPSDDTVERIESIRKTGNNLALVVVGHTETSRESSLALTKIEEAVMWAVKAVILDGEGR